LSKGAHADVWTEAVIALITSTVIIVDPSSSSNTDDRATTQTGSCGHAETASC
jgi:hypothetical protein